jgi:hypothetical protein
MGPQAATLVGLRAEYLPLHLPCLTELVILFVSNDGSRVKQFGQDFCTDAKQSGPTSSSNQAQPFLGRSEEAALSEVEGISRLKDLTRQENCTTTGHVALLALSAA